MQCITQLPVLSACTANIILIGDQSLPEIIGKNFPLIYFENFFKSMNRQQFIGLLPHEMVFNGHFSCFFIPYEKEFYWISMDIS